MRGGDTLYGTGTRCTVGFDARSGSALYALAPGRCAQDAPTWYADAALTVVGVTAGVGFPGTDGGAVRRPGTVRGGGPRRGSHDRRGPDPAHQGCATRYSAISFRSQAPSATTTR